MMIVSVVVYLVILTNSSIIFFLVGEFLLGCCGSYFAMSMTCFAYVADRTPAERRMLRITVLQLCLFTAGIVSPIGVGPVVSVIGVSNVVLIVFLISAINFAYVFFFLRNDRKVDQEPATADDQSEVPGRSYTDDETRDNPMRSVADGDTSGYIYNPAGRGDHRYLPRSVQVEPRSDDSVVDFSHSINRDIPQPRSESAVERQTWTLCDGVRRLFLLFLSPGRSRVRLNILMVTFFISILPTFDQSLMNLFEMNRPLCWTVGQVGFFTGITFAISALGALVVTPVMKRCATDWHIAITASTAAVITDVYKFFVRNSLMMYFCKCSFCLHFYCGLFSRLGAMIQLMYRPTSQGRF